MTMTASSNHEPETVPVKRVFGLKDIVAWCLVTGGIFLAFFLVDPTHGDNYLKVVTVSSMLSGTGIVSAVRLFIGSQRQAKQLAERYLMWQDELFEKERYRAALEAMHGAKARDRLHSSPNYPNGWKSEPSEWEDDTE
jgi:hypothetical protein